MLKKKLCHKEINIFGNAIIEAKDHCVNFYWECGFKNMWGIS